MQRAIVGFHVDDKDEPVADLACGHGQHVRHRPPFINRPWVLTEDGRAGMLGVELDCVRCDRMEWPAGLTREHSTKLGVWGRIEVVAGALCYIVAAPINRSFRIEAPGSAVIVPGVAHRVAPQGPVRFYVEFSRKP